MKYLDFLTAALVIVGALNWGLVAIAGLDLVATVFGMRFGEVSAASAVVYSLVGLSALYQVVFARRTLNIVKPQTVAAR